MSHLFTPKKIKSILFKNRIMLSPMCMFSSEDGFATNWHYVHYGTRAMGGAGAVILEASAVLPNGRIGIGDLGIYKDQHIEELRKIATFIQENGSVPGIQLAHSGRKGSMYIFGKNRHFLAREEGKWDLIAPSSIPFSAESPTPKAMTKEDIQVVQEAFVKAAERALKAEFKLIEIHCAHGYLLHQFLSPISNHRTDKYGGSRENRARMLMETLQKVKTVWPEDLPISVRISATDWADNGWTGEDAVWLSQELENAGIDMIDVSSGGTIAHPKIPIGPSYQLPFARAIKNKRKKIQVATVGWITSAMQAESILVNGDADFIMMGRELLRNPYFPLKAAQILKENPLLPEQYGRAF